MNAEYSETLAGHIETGSENGKSVSFIEGHDLVTVPWSRLHGQARAIAYLLQHERGLGPGAHVALLGRTTNETVAAIQGAWLAGCAVTVLPVPRLASGHQFATDLQRRLAFADADICVTDPAFSTAIDTERLAVPVADSRQLCSRATEHHAALFDRAPVDPSSPALIQFTSGSTTEPRAVVISHAQLCANITAILTGLECDPAADIVVSWLPLFHDMGLIGFLIAPMAAGITTYLASPERFTGSPAEWMRWMSRFRATITGGPPSAYAVAAKSLAHQSGLSLSSVRLLLIGAEMIDPDTVDGLCQAGGHFGLSTRSPFCVYGLAEATLAVTFPDPGSGMRVIDRQELSSSGNQETGHAPAAMRLVSVGSPVARTAVRIVDPVSRACMGAREVGEVEVTGPSVMTGYYKNRDATGATLADGWLRTGDLGSQVDGQLVICGRLKDVIIIGGRNIYPDEIERAIGDLPELRRGNVAAFGIEKRRGREGIVVVAAAPAPMTSSATKSRVNSAVLAAVGVPPVDICLVQPRTLPKTSSGKLQRHLCKRQYLNGSLRQLN